MAASKKPTERQIEYARELGVSFSADITREELSNRISAAVVAKNPPSESILQAADDFGIERNPNFTKRDYYDVIWRALDEPGREPELAAWFVYRICRHFCEGGQSPPEAARVNTETIRAIAAELAADPKIIRSIKRYDPRDVRFFGQWTSPKGYELQGGSKRTAAYKAAAALIQEHLGLSDPRARGAGGRRSRAESSDAENSGCLWLFALPPITWLLASYF